ncbi:receptor-type tyrosine-protein phosphatase epsilon-like [Cotesia typhae]|uniref:receptor-type tyrosine-protein phosphatase epsilon-like n=1 Tax=Cotesia typhae TaxID=2053667 RepID=UPI003D690F08
MGCNHSKSLDQKEFTKLWKNPKFTTILNREFCEIKREEKFFGTFYACQLRQNRANCGKLNRFCYDHSRVILPVDYGSGDYINASYIDGWTQKRIFICTEAPLRKTMYQFWKMIWLHRTRIIIMLCETNELHEEQFYRYWDPYEEGVKVVQKFRIETVKIMTRDNYKVIVLNVTDGTLELHEMIHITRLEIHRAFKKDLLRLKNPNYETPIVVHCSSGTGISVVFCAMDISISEYHSSGTISL